MVFGLCVCAFVFLGLTIPSLELVSYHLVSVFCRLSSVTVSVSFLVFKSPLLPSFYSSSSSDDEIGKAKPAPKPVTKGDDNTNP